MKLARIRADVPEGQQSYWITLSSKIFPWDEDQGTSKVAGSRMIRFISRSDREGERMLDVWVPLRPGEDPREVATDFIYSAWRFGWGLEWWVDGRWVQQ